MTSGTVPTAPQKESTSHYLIDDEHMDTFWDTIISLFERGCGLITAWFKIPPVPKEAFDNPPAQKIVMRRTTRAGVSHFFQTVLKAETPQRANELIDGFSGLVSFGAMFVIIAKHFITELPKSPRWQEWREKRRKLNEERIAAGEEPRRIIGIPHLRWPQFGRPRQDETRREPGPAPAGAPA